MELAGLMLARPSAAAGRSISQQMDIPVPRKGLALNKPVTELGPEDAIRLDNWVCRDEGPTIRDGYTLAGSGHGTVRHLMALGTTIYSASDTAIKSLSGIGAEAALSSPAVATRWGSDVLSNAGGMWLIAASGAHAPYYTNGSVWTAMTITAPPLTPFDTTPEPIPTLSNLCNPTVWNGRVWFYERGTLNLWYLDHGAIKGAIWLYPLQDYCRRGGEITAIAVMTGDNADNPDDSLVIVTSAGEMLIYSGDDPNSSESFGKQGVTRVPLPVGYRPFAQVGGDLAYLSVDGLYTVSNLLGNVPSKRKVDDISDALGDEITTLLAASPTSQVWQVIESAEQGLVIINTPSSTQYVMAPETGGWSKFTGLAATAWVETSAGLYFGRADGVIARHTGAADNSAAISALAITGWNQMRGGRKVMHRARLIYKAAHPYRPRIEVLRDYLEPSGDYPATDTDSGFWNWPEVYDGTAGVSTARPMSNRLGQWRGLSGYADDAIAVVISMKATTAVSMQKIQLLVEKGGPL